MLAPLSGRVSEVREAHGFCSQLERFWKFLEKTQPFQAGNPGGSFLGVSVFGPCPTVLRAYSPLRTRGPLLVSLGDPVGCWGSATCQASPLPAVLSLHPDLEGLGRGGPPPALLLGLVPPTGPLAGAKAQPSPRPPPRPRLARSRQVWEPAEAWSSPAQGCGEASGFFPPQPPGLPGAKSAGFLRVTPLGPGLRRPVPLSGGLKPG